MQAAILHNMAGIRVTQGDLPAGLELYRQSLGIPQRIGDARGTAAALHAMANIPGRPGRPRGGPSSSTASPSI
ncbi:MAG: hypothetical protein M3N68_14615 [Actinomycetota bacterium]|nr:hypothetical protein [Actinomycetota bacterium]